MGYSIWYPVIARIAGAMGHVARKMVFSMRAQVGFRSGLWNKKITNHNKKITLVGTHTHMYTSIYTRKTAVSPSPKLSFVTFEFCSSCRRNAVFSFFKCKKMHFDLRPPMNLSTSILRGRRNVFWSYKKVVWHFRWQARDFLRFWHVLDGLFFGVFFLAGCGAASHLGGGSGGWG